MNSAGNPDNSFTENLRSGTFSAANQDAWNKYSLQAVNEIASMILQGRTLYEIYEYARELRNKIAYETGAIDFRHFGQVRETRNSDNYISGEITGTKADPEVFVRIVRILVSEINAFEKKQCDAAFDLTHKHHFDPKILGDIFLYSYPAGETKHKKIEIVTRLNPESKKEGFAIVKVTHGQMNSKIYKSGLSAISKPLDEISKSRLSLEEFILGLGYLAHDLSEPMFLSRGSAAVNGWILRGVAKSKGLVIGTMHVCGLPFDIYEQIQLDRDKYARDFARDMISQITPYNDEILLKEKIQTIIWILDQYHDHLLPGQSPSLFGGGPSHANAANKLRAEIIDIGMQDVPAAEKLNALEKALEPYVSKTAAGGSRLQKALQCELNGLLLLRSGKRAQHDIKPPKLV